MRQLVEKFKDCFQNFDVEHLDAAAQLYDENATFEDPIGQINGAGAIAEYFQGVSLGVKFCRFHFQKTLIDGHSAVLEWTMEYAHPKLKGGKTLHLKGASSIRVRVQSNGELRVVSHRDYYDMGEMVYEHLPGLGYLVRRIKNGFKTAEKSSQKGPRLADKV